MVQGILEQQSGTMATKYAYIEESLQASLEEEAKQIGATKTGRTAVERPRDFETFSHIGEYSDSDTVVSGALKCEHRHSPVSVSWFLNFVHAGRDAARIARLRSAESENQLLDMVKLRIRCRCDKRCKDLPLDHRARLDRDHVECVELPLLEESGLTRPPVTQPLEFEQGAVLRLMGPVLPVVKADNLAVRRSRHPRRGWPQERRFGPDKASVVLSRPESERGMGRGGEACGLEEGGSGGLGVSLRFRVCHCRLPASSLDTHPCFLSGCAASRRSLLSALCLFQSRLLFIVAQRILNYKPFSGAIGSHWCCP